MEAVFERGVAAGVETNEEMKRTVLTAMGFSPQLATARSAGPRRSAKTGIRRSSGAKTRAPKGAAREAIENALSERDGLTTKEIEEFARQQNPSINSKTIYNELLRQKEKYRQEAGTWYRVVSAPQSAATPPAPTVALATPAAASPTPTPPVAPPAAPPSPTAVAAPLPQPAAQPIPAAAQSSPQGEAGGPSAASPIGQ